MNDYKQPSFYRFNQDSILLSKFVLQEIRNAHKILDLGAGSGVIGLEVAQVLRPLLLLSLEVQSDYEECLKENMEYFLPKESKGRIEIKSFKDFSPIEYFDLILCNPPYYFPDSGRPASDPRRQIARSFSIDNWDILFGLTKRSLDQNGRAYFVLKNEKDYLKRVLSFIPEGMNQRIVEQGDIIFLVLS